MVKVRGRGGSIKLFAVTSSCSPAPFVVSHQAGEKIVMPKGQGLKDLRDKERKKAQEKAVKEAAACERDTVVESHDMQL